MIEYSTEHNDFEFGFYRIKSKYHREYPDKPYKNKWFKFNVQPSLYNTQACITTIEMVNGKKVEVNKIMDIQDVKKLLVTKLIEKISIEQYIALK